MGRLKGQRLAGQGWVRDKAAGRGPSRIPLAHQKQGILGQDRTGREEIEWKGGDG